MFNRDKALLVCAYAVELCAFGVIWGTGAMLVLHGLGVSDPVWLMAAGLAVGLPSRDISKWGKRKLLAHWYWNRV